MRITPILALVLPALIGASCQSKTQTASLTCPDIAGVDEILSSDGPDIIVIGEIHGMTRPPEFVSALTCHSLKSGFSTTLALELRDDDGHLAEYLRSDGSDQARDNLFEDPLWTNGFTDGRSSEAMLSLIYQARGWSSQGFDFQVSPFMGRGFDYKLYETRNEHSAAWEKHLAKGVLDASTGRDKTIVLVGMLHAMRGHRDYGELDYALMMEHLPKDQTLTFNVATSAGTVWGCVGQPVKCGERRSSGSILPDHPFKQDEFSIVTSDEITDDVQKLLRFDSSRYDGIVFAGQAKASPPVNAENRQPFGAN